MDPLKAIKQYESAEIFAKDVEARYLAACEAIGKDDPSLAITDSHSDIPTLLARWNAINNVLPVEVILQDLLAGYTRAWKIWKDSGGDLETLKDVIHCGASFSARIQELFRTLRDNQEGER